MWLNSLWWLAACNWVMSVLSAVLSTRVGRCRKFAEVSYTECIGQGSEFPVICNHCGVLAAWSHKMLKIVEKFLIFLEKRPLIVKFLEFCSRSFYHNTDLHVVFKFCEICQGQPSRMYSRVLQISSQSILFRQNYSRMHERHQNVP